MNRYVALLRGMNLGGRRIKNEDLKRELEALGLNEVSCFRASGNVIFASGESNEAKLAKRVEAGLGEALGYDVPIFLRSAAELRKVAGAKPFEPAAREASKGKLQVAFLRSKPNAAARKQVLALATNDDRLAIEGRELYWLPSGGLSDSDLDLKAIDAALGPTTIRTVGTVTQIVARLSSR